MCKMLDKFRLLLWKNWVLQCRRPVQTLLEIMGPIIFTMLLVIIRSLVKRKKYDTIHYEPFCTMPADFAFTSLICSETVGQNMFNDFLGVVYYKDYRLVYSPKSEALNKIMVLFGHVFGSVIELENSSMLEQYFQQNDTLLTFAGIQFDDSYKDLKNISLINNYNISIRFPGETRNYLDPDFNNWKTNLIYPSFQTLGPRQFNFSTGAAPSYYGEGFLALQHLLTLGLIAGRKNITDQIELLAFSSIPLISMRRYPYIEWIEDPLLGPQQYILGLIILLSLVYPSINIVRSITTEKERQLKESMKIMGLPNWLHWTAWFVKCFIFLQLSVILIVTLLKTKLPNSNTSVLTYSDPLVMFLFLICYICASISFCFAISVMFDKANSAAATSGLLWFISYVPYMFLQTFYQDVGLPIKLFICLFSNSAMGLGFRIMLMFEGVDEGVQWNNLFTPSNPEDSLTLGHIMIVLVFDTVIYLMVAVYVEMVFPGEYGVPKPWYFLFTTNYWCGSSKEIQEESVNIKGIKMNGQGFFEAKQHDLGAGVQINNLYKVFNGKVVIKDFSLNLLENQITVLLGHNGAGKSTIMSMLTGMIRPTSGTAVINGFDIRTDMEGVRSSLGLCPQHNIIFDKLTVEEHLYFATKLKSVPNDIIQAEVDKYIQLLELEDKRHSKSSTLSGGMQRKLCVGMALCGNSKVVILDEPTSGMDPSARRGLWALLRDQKQGRTILLTTHFMDEADHLGDKIAIMAEGTLKCSGSSFFVKKEFGTGYSLILEKSQNCNVSQITELLHKYVCDIKIYDSLHSELRYHLKENDSSKFEGMLRDLENNAETLGILSYGISMTTLEEVFGKFSSTHVEQNISNGVSQTKDSISDHKLRSDNVRPRFTSGWKLYINQFRAMLMKKALATCRSWIQLLVQILIPVILTIAGVVISRNNKNTETLPPLTMDLRQFDNPVVLVENITNSEYVNTYLSVLKEQGSEVEITSNITNRVLELIRRSPLNVSMSYIVGAEFSTYENEDHITVWFNSDPYHSPGVSLALVLNVIFKNVLKCPECSIQFTNQPNQYHLQTKMNQMMFENGLGFQLALELGIAMAFVSSFYVLFIVKENVSKSKHLQFVSGLNMLIFWVSTVVWDTLMFLLTGVATTLTLMCFQEEGFETVEELGRFFLIFLLFGWAFLPLVYVTGQFFKIPSSGYIKLTIFACFTGIAGFLMVEVLSIERLEVEHVADGLHWLFLIFPHYTFISAVMTSYSFFARKKICNLCELEHCHKEMIEKMCTLANKSFYIWEKPGIGRNLFFFIIVGFILYVILLGLEYKVYSKMFSCKTQNLHSQQLEEAIEEDSDVAKETQTIREVSKEELANNYALIIRDLTKYYKDFLAVNSLCIGIKNFECFGLLGVNGAGKTTTFKMITGSCNISFGDCWVKGFSVRNQLTKVYKCVGYCPQFDALLDHMTVQEMIKMYALLRGIHPSECNLVVENLARDFDFVSHVNKEVKVLSGGNKRKLSSAIAVIGDPPVVYLDEPSTGMDVSAKRRLWNALCKIRDSGKCLILTSHSMEECEALCTRLAIMVNGRFKCLGSSQHLKNKFAKGYNLTIKLKKGRGDEQCGNTESIERFISNEFPRAKLIEKHEELLSYLIEEESRPWFEMFGIMERAKMEDYNIEDYFLGQSNLEQVFMTFTRSQK